MLLTGAADPWLVRLYREVLGRSLDASGQAQWGPLLQAGLGETTVALAVVGSAEAHADLVPQWYGSYLGRAVDPTGFTAFTAALDAGRERDQALAGLLASDEYFHHVGGTGPTYVTALFHDALGRAPDPSGAATYEQALAAGVSRATLAGLVLGSDERFDDEVGRLYPELLQRPADAAGLDAWLAARHGGATLEQVTAAIFGSAEFQALGAAPAATTTGTTTTSALLDAASGPATGVTYSALQDVATFAGANGAPVTLSAPGLQLSAIQVTPAPADQAAALPWGLFGFTVSGAPVGGNATVQVLLPGNAQPGLYYKTDPLTGALTPFPYDGTTGAEVNGNVVTLHFVDGGAGDADGVANGVIVDPGGPGSNGLPPDVVPLLGYNDVVQTAPGADGGNPMTPAFSPATSVRYTDGVLRLAVPELSSAGFGAVWGQTPSWTNATAYAAAGFNGSGIVDDQLPTLLKGTNGTTFAVVSNGVNARFFDQSGSTYTERHFLGDTLTYSSSTHDYLLTDPAGDQIKFNDFSSGLPANERGQLKSYTDPGGTGTSVTAYTTDGKVQEVQRSSTVGSTTLLESYLYTYFSSGVNAGLLQNVTLRRSSNGGTTWSTVRQVDYAYFDGTGDTHGNTGDLKTATLKDGAGTALDTVYFRYYTGESGGYVHGLKYYFSAASYGRLLAAYATPGSATDAQAAPYADDAFQYDSSQRVTQAVVQGAGASGSNGGLGTFSYTYTASSNSADPNHWATKTIETLPDSNQNIVYTNAYGEPMLAVYADAGSGLKWDTFFKYDSYGRLSLTAAPSAVTGYDDTKADLLNLQMQGSPPNVTFNYQYLSDSSGLITTVSYGPYTTATPTSAGAVAGYVLQTQVQQGELGSAITLGSQQYFLRQVGSVAAYPLASQTVDRNTDGSGQETTSFSYSFFTGQIQIQNDTVTRPTIASGQNGPGVADADNFVYDSYGRTVWHKDADGFIDYTAYDQASGAVTKHIVDVDTTKTSDFQNLPSGWSTPSGGGLHLITLYQVDVLGRDTSITDPNGNVTYVTYNDPNHEERVYPGWNSSTNLPTGPTQDYREDRPGSYVEQLTMTATPHLTGGVPDGTEAVSNLQTLSRDYVSSGGQLVRHDAYFSLSGVTWSTSQYIGTQNTNFYTTLDDYDVRGRPSRVQHPTGTIDRTVYDGLSRVVSAWVGTNDTPASGSWSPTNNTSPSNMVETVSFQYDGGGVGDGDRTQETDYPGGSAANRVIQFYFDWRDRLVASKQGVQGTEDTTTHRPILYQTLDNLGEVTKVQRYDGDGISLTVTSGVPNAPSSSLLRAQTVTAYDDQRRVYQTVVYDVNQSTGAVSSTGLTTNMFYSHRGQVIETSEPGGLVDKKQYDGASGAGGCCGAPPRVIEEYLTDGAAGTSWSSAGSVTGDNVLQQMDTQFDKDGKPILVTTRQRFHNETATGALGNATTSPKARVSYVASYYDPALRLTATVNVGTNGGSAYTRPGSVPSSSATVLVTTAAYMAAGWVQDVVDPRGLDLRTSYDNLGRTTQTIENYTNGTPTATSNKTTNFTYDGDNHTLTLQAVETGGASETTQWVYGVTTASGSTINSNDILSAVQYPDPSTGSPSSSYQESYTVDTVAGCCGRGQELLTYTDRNGTTHTYSQDVLGRQTADAITTLATGVDNSVLRIETAYDTGDRPYLHTTYNAASGGSIVNQVQDAFNGLGQLSTEYQAHAGAVNTSTTPSVQYVYSELAGGVNHSRLVSMTYPNGRVLTFTYNTGVDTSISRLSSISDTSATLESYKYLGLGTVVERDHPQTNVNLTYISQSGGTGDAGDQYTGLDRFGRVVEVNWYNPSTSSSTDDFQYGYDQDGNPLYKNNTLNSAFSELYHASGAGNGYDGLNQLSAFVRGTLSASSGGGGVLDTVASPSTTESWGYDAVGNFASVTLNGTQTNRTHNQQNEVTAVGSNNLAFDKNGNTTTDDQSHTLKYDAWNRLVSDKNGGTTLEAYSYDALGRRITENPGTLRDLYFSSAWQVVEEDVSGSMQDQYVWSSVYVDALVERDTPTQRLYVQQDANWSATALVNTSGTVVERYIYDPYGSVTYLTANWGSLSASAYAWVYLHQGGRLDTATGLYSFRRRDYSPTLDRWVQVDPIGYSGGDHNVYRFAANDPRGATDPTGLKTMQDCVDQFWKEEAICAKAFFENQKTLGFAEAKRIYDLCAKGCLDRLEACEEGAEDNPNKPKPEKPAQDVQQQRPAHHDGVNWGDVVWGGAMVGLMIVGAVTVMTGAGAPVGTALIAIGVVGLGATAGPAYAGGHGGRPGLPDVIDENWHVVNPGPVPPIAKARHTND